MSGTPDVRALSAVVFELVKHDMGELRAKLDEWIHWVVAHTDADGDIPSVFDLARQASEDFAEQFMRAVVSGVGSPEIGAGVADEPAQAQGELVVRADKLIRAASKLSSSQAELQQWCLPGEEASTPEQAEEPELLQFHCECLEADYVRAEDVFRSLVRLLPAEDCPGTWRDIRWEILNSVIANDWDRAYRLLGRAVELRLRSDGELAAIRGQFRFLSVFDNRIAGKVRVGLRNLRWEPRIYEAESPDIFDQPDALRLFAMGLCDRDAELVLDDSGRSTLLDAANDLQKAFLTLALPYPYRAVLGRCHYCTGHFHDAAEQYSALLQTAGQLGQPKLFSRLFGSLSLSYRQAGETERVKETLERWAHEFPGEKGLYLQLAELEARGANYSGIADYLRKEIDRSPAVEEDWKLSALLALCATQDPSKAVDALRETPLWQVLRSALAEYWPPFPGLAEKARDEWTFGIILAHVSYWPEHQRTLKAGECCAKAVDIELRERIFGPYKKHINERPELKSIAQREASEAASGKFCKFLTGNGRLGLGEMIWILKKSRGSAEPIFQDFQGWVSGSQRLLMQDLDVLDTITVFRNDASHGRISSARPAEVIRLCKQVIEALR